MESAAQALEPYDLPDNVIQFPVPDRSCFTCEHWRGIEQGAVSWCSVYDQVIDSEAYEAEDCFSYERVEEGTQPILDTDPRGDDDDQADV